MTGWYEPSRNAAQHLPLPLPLPLPLLLTGTSSPPARHNTPLSIRQPLQFHTSHHRKDHAIIISVTAFAKSLVRNSNMGEETGGELELRRVPLLVENLISLSASIKSFVGKWQSIRNKLEQLSSALAAGGVAGVTRSIGDSVLCEILNAIANTVNETHELARCCNGHEPYAGGKLLMRSNLDLAAAKFELHIKSLAGIYASGILAHSNAIVVSKPVVGAGREEMRFYLNDLFSRLRIGDSEMRAGALSSLVEVLREDDKYVRIIVAEMTESLNLLCSSLGSGNPGIQESAAEVITMLAGYDVCRPALVLAGVISSLVRVLDVGSEVGKEKAARALKKMTENTDNAWAVSAQGGVTLLLKICSKNGGAEESAEMVICACGVLRNLLGVAEIRRFMVEEGAVPILLRLTKSKEECFQIQAMELLQAMAAEDEDAKRAVVREGGIEYFVKTLDPKGRSSSKARETALRAIETVSLCCANSLVRSGFLERLLLLIRNGEMSVQESALKVSSRLCLSSEEAKRAMGEVGFMPELVRLLNGNGTSSEMREMAARALSSMVSVQKNQRRFIQEEQNVRKILEVLNQAEQKAVTKKLLLNTLMSLSDSSSGRRSINACGYVKHLERLAEADVPDAKRIVKKLSGNRFRNLIHAIWSSP